MKPIYKRITAILIVVATAVIIWLFFFRKTEAAVTVVSALPERGYVAQSVTATGKIEPEDTVTVGTQISGIIRYLYVDFNSKVKP